MPDRDGTTCGTCLTLNPPGAPACVRCNTPLGAAREASVPEPAAVPGSSRTRAAAVQPPGYGMEPDPPEPEPEPGPEPAAAAEVVAPEPAGVSRKVTVAGLVVVAMVLVVGAAVLWPTAPRAIDTGAVAATVSGELSARGAGTVRVTCPDDVRSEAGVTFDCLAADDSGSRRTIRVTVLDGDGRYRWELAG